MLNIYDLHLVLSVIANKINDIKKYDKNEHELKLYYDYKNLYFKLRKQLLNKVEKDFNNKNN